jgi:hypothetical protein
MIVRTGNVGLSPYRNTLESARQELIYLAARKDELAQEVSAVDQRIAWLTETIRALEPLCAVEIEEEYQGTLKQICLEFFSQNPGAISASDLKACLERYGITFGQVNPLAVLHTTLRRLEQDGKVTGQKGPDGRILFQPVYTNVLPDLAGPDAVEGSGFSNTNPFIMPPQPSPTPNLFNTGFKRKK